MAKAAKITFKEFRTKFATEDDCRKYLFDNCLTIGFQTDLNALNVVEESITISKHANFASARNAVTRRL